MTNLESIKQEKINLLNSVASEIEQRVKASAQITREKESLEAQAYVIQGAIAMLDELIADEEKVVAEKIEE